MSSDLTRQIFPSNENSSHMDVDLEAAQQVPLPPATSGEDEDLLVYSDDEFVDVPAARNSGAQSGTAPTPKTEENEMDVDSSASAARLNTSSNAEADNGEIERLSGELQRVSRLEAKDQAASSSGVANERYFSRAFVSMAKTNAGILSASINPSNALQEPVRASGPPPFLQALEYGRRLVLERERLKRLRSPSPDSSCANETARSEPEDADMDDTASRPPFNFREIVDPKSSSQCFIKADNHPWFGTTHDKLPNYQVNVQILGGRLGLPMIKLCFSIHKEEFFNKTPGKSVKEDAFHKFWCIWQPGLILDPSHPQFQISDLEISHGPNLNDKVEMPEAFMKDTTGIINRVVGVSFRSHTVTLEGSDRGLVKYMDSDLLDTLDHVRLRPSKVTVWYVARGGVESHITNTLNHFRNALENHLPPLHQYLTPPAWELNVDLNLAPIRHFQGGMYCKYSEVNNIEDVNQTPTSFWTLTPKLHFQSELEFEIYYSVGVIREYQWQRGRMAHMSARPHKIFLLKTYRYPTVRSQSDPKLTKAQSKFRNSFYGYVRMTPNEKGLVESAPPEGTIFTLDWANKQGGNGTHLVSPKEEQWFGKVCGAQSETLTQLGAHFCLVLTKPPNARNQRAFEHPTRVRAKLPKAYLRPIVNDTPAGREVTAVRDFCKTSRDDLSLLRLSAVADPHHGIVEYTDLSGGPGGQEENKATYLARLAEKRNMFNEGQMKVMEGVCSIVNKMMLVQGPPGTGKTTMLSHLVDVLIEVDHTILITCASNGAVDENARKLWEVLPKDKKVLRLEIITLDRDNTFGRKAGDYVLPDAPLPSRQSHVDDWEQDPMYLTMLAQLMTAEIVVGHESAHVDRFVKESEALKKDYAAIYEHNEKRHDFPRGMSMAFRIWEMVQADIKASEDFEHEDTAMNRAIARSQGTLQTPHDPSLRYRQLIDQYNTLEGLMKREELDELRYEYEGQVARVIRDADVILTTCNNSGNDVIRATFKPSVLIVDEAAQARLPTTLVPMTAYSDWMAAILVGDQAQLQPVVTSKDANEFEANLKTSLFALVIQKGYKSFLLNTQYRMSPQISRFPSSYFYKKELLDAESVKQVNLIRQQVRNVSFRDYGIKGSRTSPGSEYWVIDVAHAVSRREENGTSLQNYAHASVIINLMRKLVKEGVPKAAIQVLSFYKGQIKTIVKAAYDVPELDDLRSVSTVDIFQSQEARVVILDLVVAHQRTGKQTEALDDVYNVATQHVRNPNRLCVGLTRARDGLIVIANANAIGKAGSHATDGGRTLSSLLIDARERNVLYIDKDTLDTHPIAMDKMEKSNEYRKQVAAELDLNEHLAFIDEIVRKKHQSSKKSGPMTTQRPITYRSGSQKPTRLPHVPESLQAKIPSPVVPKHKPKSVGKDQTRVKYDNNVWWQQPPQRSEANQPQGPSGVSGDKGRQRKETSDMTDSTQQDQSPKEVRQDKGKQRMQSPENADPMEDSQSPEQVRDNKGKQPTQSPERTDPMEDDQPPEDGSEEGEVEEQSAASGSNNTSQAPPPDVAPPKQRGQRLQSTPDMEWRRGAGSGNVRGWGGRGGPRGGGRGSGKGGGRGTGRGGKGRGGGNPRGGQSSAGRA